MRVVVQRVSSASVVVDEQAVSQIGRGLLLLLGVGLNDSEARAKTLVDKIVHLRIFADADGKMNASLLDIAGSVLVVSQFTLYADTRKGRRPSFINAAHPAVAKQLFEHFKSLLAEYKITVASGVFGADMQVTLCNDGPVTLWLDSEDLPR